MNNYTLPGAPTMENQCSTKTSNAGGIPDCSSKISGTNCLLHLPDVSLSYMLEEIVIHMASHGWLYVLIVRSYTFSLE